MYEVKESETLPRISIHALREEGDNSRPDVAVDEVLFTTPPPGVGAHLLTSEIFPSPINFITTPPAWRATRRDHADQWLRDISIHALREEGDSQRSGCGWWSW